MSKYTIDSPLVQEYALALSTNKVGKKIKHKSALRRRAALALLRLKNEFLPENNGEEMVSVSQLAALTFDEYAHAPMKTRRGMEQDTLSAGTLLTNMSARTDGQVSIAIVKVTEATRERYEKDNGQFTVQDYMKTMGAGRKFNTFYVCENKNGLIFEAYIQIQNAKAKGLLNANTLRKVGFISNGIITAGTAKQGEKIFRFVRPLIPAQFASEERRKIKEQKKRLAVGA